MMGSTFFSIRPMIHGNTMIIGARSRAAVMPPGNVALTYLPMIMPVLEVEYMLYGIFLLLSKENLDKI